MKKASFFPGHANAVTALALTLVLGCGSGLSSTSTSTCDDCGASSASLTISGGQTLTMAVGESAQLLANVTDGAGGRISFVVMTWESSDESVATIGADGLVSAVALGSTTLTATAVIVETGEELSDSVTLEVANGDDSPPAPACPPNENIAVSSGASWSNRSLLQAVSGSAVVELFARASTPNIDALVVLSNGSVSQFADAAATLRFAPNGFFDARDGSSYRADQQIAYAANQWYRVRFDVNVSAGRFGVSVGACGDALQPVVADAAFRAASATIPSANNVAVWSIGNGTIDITEPTFPNLPPPAPGDSPPNSDGGDPAAGDFGSTLSSVSITPNRTEGTAPLGALFSVAGSSTQSRVVIPFHDIETVWSFDDPGQFTALGNSPIWGTDRNVAYGPRATHVFSEAGTYSVAASSYDGASRRTAKAAITVNDPDAVFAGADTAVVSQSSNFGGAPGGAAQFTSIAQAISHLSGRTNARLLLRAGETFSDGVGINETGGSGRRYYVGAFGSGPRPVISLSAKKHGVRFNTGSNSHVELMVVGLDIRGVFDPTSTNPNVLVTSEGVSFQQAGLTTHKVVYDCIISGVYFGIRADGGVRETTPLENLYVGNTRIMGWGNYGVFSGDAAQWGFSGTAIQQPTGTVNSAGKNKAPYYAAHGPFRISRAWDTVVLSNVDITSFNDWAGSDVNRSMQPVLRWNTGRGGTDPELVVDRLRGEGGPLRFYNFVESNRGDSIRAPAFVLADRIHHVSTDHASTALEMPLGGTTVRNLVLVVPNSRAGVSTGVRRFIRDSAGGTVGPGNNSRRSEVYSSALVDLRSDANAGNRELTTTDRDFTLGGFSQISPSYVGSNILYSPNMVTGGAPGNPTPLDRSGRWMPLYDGERWTTAPVDTRRAYGMEVTARFEPVAGSNQIGAASGKVSLIDFDGNYRQAVLDGLSRTSRSNGPYEPALED